MGWVFCHISMGKSTVKLDFLYIVAFELKSMYCTFLGIHRLKSHIKLWVALIEIAHRLTYI